MFVIIRPGNGLVPVRHQAITQANAHLLLIRPQRTYFNEIIFEIQQFHSRKCIWKCQPFRLGVSMVMWQIHLSSMRASDLEKNCHWILYPCNVSYFSDMPLVGHARGQPFFSRAQDKDSVYPWWWSPGPWPLRLKGTPTSKWTFPESWPPLRTRQSPSQYEGWVSMEHYTLEMLYLIWKVSAQIISLYYKSTTGEWTLIIWRLTLNRLSSHAPRYQTGQICTTQGQILPLRIVWWRGFLLLGVIFQILLWISRLCKCMWGSSIVKWPQIDHNSPGMLWCMFDLDIHWVDLQWMFLRLRQLAHGVHWLIVTVASSGKMISPRLILWMMDTIVNILFQLNQIGKEFVVCLMTGHLWVPEVD